MIIITDFDEQNFTCKINALWSINIIYLSLEWAAETMVCISTSSRLWQRPLLHIIRWVDRYAMHTKLLTISWSCYYWSVLTGRAHRAPNRKIIEIITVKWVRWRLAISDVKCLSRHRQLPRVNYRMRRMADIFRNFIAIEMRWKCVNKKTDTHFGGHINETNYSLERCSPLFTEQINRFSMNNGAKSFYKTWHATPVHRILLIGAYGIH